MKDHARLMVSVAALVALTVATGCAPGRSVVRGNWPNGRIEGPAMSRPVAVEIYRPVAVAVETDDWLPMEPTYDGMSAAELNRMGVLQPIYFALDRADVDASQMAALDANIEWLTQVPGAAIVIEGHADERGTGRYNLALGQRRAEAARDYLVSRGIHALRIEVVSYGEELPADPGHDTSAWDSNRRDEFVITATGQ
jgi:peptidoglycan-associated lipoprotein